MPYSAAMRLPPPSPKMCSAWPHLAAHVHRHVLHDAQDRHADLLEHLDALLGVEQRDVLRRGDDHRAGHRHALRQGQLDVAGAGRQVDDQVVQVLPVGLAQQLLQRLGGHRAAPDHGFVLGHQEADRHDLHAVVLHRLHGLAVGRFGPALDAHHHRLARAVDVGVEQAHRRALGGQRQRQVHGHGALAHAALAGGHRDDVLDLGQQRDAALGRVRDDLAGHVDRDVLHPGHALGGRDQRVAQCRDLALGGITQLDVERDVPVVDLQVLHRLGADEVLAGIGVGDGREGLEQLVGGGGHGLIFPVGRV